MCTFDNIPLMKPKGRKKTKIIMTKIYKLKSSIVTNMMKNMESPWSRLTASVPITILAKTALGKIAATPKMIKLAIRPKPYESSSVKTLTV